MDSVIIAVLQMDFIIIALVVAVFQMDSVIIAVAVLQM